MWIVMTSSARPRGSTFGHYRNVALVKIHPHYAAWGKTPAKISEQARGVLYVLHMGKHNVGKTDRCAYARVKARAEAIAFERNNNPDKSVDYMSLGGSA